MIKVIRTITSLGLKEAKELADNAPSMVKEAVPSNEAEEVKKKLEEAGYKLDERVRQMPPLGFFDYNHLQMRSYCTISDSGTISEESAIMGFPAITVRQAHERPEGMDEGVIIMSGLDLTRIIDSIAVAVKQIQTVGPARIPQDYDVDQVSWKIAKIILSYVDFVNRKVWFKDQ